MLVSKFKRIFEDSKTDECLTDAVEAFKIVGRIICIFNSESLWRIGLSEEESDIHPYL